jgi:uncharacterized protein
MGKVFKILSIDGGGIKGLYSARILQHLEEVYQCNLSDYFDLLCGTSTGGIIALGLSLKKPAANLAELYAKNGKNIFPWWRKILWTGTLRQALFWGKYNDRQLKAQLVNVFGESLIGESNNLLCIPSHSVTDGRNIVFRWNHPEGGLTRDNKASYVEVALATSAAPTYFPLAEVSGYDGKQFIDGGVWSNNPCLVGIAEALRYFVGKGKPYDSIQILSISSLNHIGGMNPGKWKKRSFWGWKDEIFNTTLRAQSDFTHFFMEKLSESTATVPINYIRIPSEELAPEHATTVKLDKATKKVIKLISGKGNDRGLISSKDPQIAEFFKTKKTYKTK